MSRKKKATRSRAQAVERRSRFDIFHGNVNNPGEFVFIYSLIGIMCIATLIFFAVTSAPRSPEDLNYREVHFTRYEIQEERLLLYTDDTEAYYAVPAYRETMTNPEEFFHLCRAGATLHIGYVEYPKAPEPYFGLERIWDAHGNIYLTMEAVHAYRWGDAPAFYAIFGGITALFLFIVIMSVYVARHPERFSRRTIRLFFKDGVLRRY